MKRKSDNQVQIAYRKIKLKKQNPREAEQIAGKFKLSAVASRVLAARGFKADEKLRHFMEPTLKDGLADPAGLKNLDQACELIAGMANLKKSIAICCDFDVDGLSGGAQLHHFFMSSGIASKVFVPDRFLDGYGLNERMVREIASQGFALLVAVDYGTRNEAELELAQELGLKTIVIDHHHVGGARTPADVFINPQQKGCGFADGVLCASGLAWYVLAGLKKILKQSSSVEVRSYLDLACLGTICDMVPLTDTNRVIAKRGLDLLGQTERAGLRALKKVIGINSRVSCSNVSFGIGPRLNAAGRMVNAESVIELLTTSDSSRAASLAGQLNRLNLERQDTELRVKEHAIEQIRKSGSLPSGIAVWDPEYHTGVIGIVAQRLVESFYRPAAVMGLDSTGVYKGSVRGIRGFSVVEALESVGKLLIKFGGHEGAGGFSVSEKLLPEFAQAFAAECGKRLKHIETEPFAEADAEAELSDIELPLIREFENFAPFGMGNPGPQLLIKELRVIDIKILKDAHTKAILSDGQRFICGLMWRQTSHPALLRDATVNIVCRPDCNEFGGNMELQANLQAVERVS